MGGRRVCFTVEDDVWDRMHGLALQNGFSGVPALARHSAVRDLNAADDSGDSCNVTVQVDNFKELADYCAVKKFKTVECFAIFAMAQYMMRYPVSGHKKQET